MSTILEEVEAIVSGRWEQTRLLPPPPTPAPTKGATWFQVLGVSPNASPREVKAAYLRLARQYHPDLNPSPEAKEMFCAVTEAYNSIRSAGKLAPELARCPMVKAKQRYAEMLGIVKRHMTLIDMELNPTAPPDEEMSVLGVYLYDKCPDCSIKNLCDRVTGFDQVEDVHNQLMRKAMQKAFKEGLQRL